MKSSNRTLAKLYRPTDQLTGLPCKGRAKNIKNKIHAFPLFDQSAALANLPFTITMFSNSGNVEALSKLLFSHFDKDCQICINCVSQSAINVKQMLKFINVMLDMNPDSIMCVQSTKVDGYSIRASMYKKFTMNTLIYNSVSRSVRDPVLLPFLGKSRSDFVAQLLASESVLNREITKVRGSDETKVEQDLLIYLRLDMEMGVNALTKRISQMTIRHQLSSIVPVEKLSQFD